VTFKNLLKGFLYCQFYKKRGVLKLEVKVVDNQLEYALRIFKKKLAQAGTSKETKRRRFYEKPSVKKRRTHAEALERHFKIVRKPYDG
jgi:small subunit ribosomal protein S21